MVAILTDVARELYGLRPQDFTAARNARAQELKSSDAALAKQVAVMKKPSPAAWVVNLLARENVDELTALLDLGEQMRTAQEHLERDALRRLGGERRVAIAALAAAGADLAAGLGHRPTASVVGEVEQTLQAATSDPSAAAAIASGLLVKPLRAVGYEPVDLDGAVAVSDPESWPEPRGRSRGAALPDPVQLADVRRRKEARREAERLERDADVAEAEVDALDRRAHRLTLRRTSLEAEIAELREQLDTASAALASVVADGSALADARAEAHTAGEDSRTRARDAREVADSLEEGD
ncbi:MULTISPECIES: hypothetical protein [Cryobacterium]|uniref:hypothetical protein n=1 Tax=Cryobacterium TaxID=69578 RepID=UPI000CD3FFF2|nr:MULTISPECIES: hypothetical protein [Cryobacterium]POH68678.1 hypothetical protein C3B60_05710 [Cryobacterium zongtaii]TFC48557.1 hypothetical protein E3O57_02040 [Cryobacterium sp. TMN-39-2]